MPSVRLSPVERVSVEWPTEDARVELSWLIGRAYNELETLVFGLQKIITQYDDDDVWPTPLPNLETVGVLYDLFDMVRMEAAQLDDKAAELASIVDRVNMLRLDADGVGADDQPRTS